MLKSNLSSKIPWEELLGQDTEIVVGCSGGADSVCLLLLVLQQAKVRGLKVRCVHINHNLRGEESDGDEDFVRRLCTSLNVPFTAVSIDVAKDASDNGRSIEESARILRYKALREQAGGALIAVAHNSDDQAETVLWNIIRGCDLTGLAGMKPRDGDIARPLLRISRKEIEDYLKECGQAYRTDSTNNINDYTRNRIRNELLPYIRANINAGVSEHLTALAESAHEQNAYMNGQLELLRGEHGEELSGGTIALELFGLPRVLIGSLVYTVIVETAGRKKDIERKHVDAVISLYGGEVGSRLQLPYELVAIREYEAVRVVRAAAYSEEHRRNREQSTRFIARLNEQLKNAETFSFGPEKNPIEIPDREFIKWFDCDTIFPIALWRTARPGDYITLSGGIKKPLNRFMIDAKIPRSEREHLPLLAVGNEIAWIPGCRIGESFKITERTKTIIEVTYEV